MSVVVTCGPITCTACPIRPDEHVGSATFLRCTGEQTLHGLPMTTLALPTGLSAAVAVALVLVCLAAGAGLAATLHQRLGLAVTTALATAPGLLLLGIMGISEGLAAVDEYRPVALLACGIAAAAAVAVVTAAAGDTGALVRSALGWRPMMTELAIGVPLVGVGGLLLLTGFTTAPNNPDSLSYHLPRIMQWFQQGSFEPFPTPYPAQVYLPPGAEQAQAFVLALTGSDHAMFLVQWTAWVAMGLTVHAAARGVGASRGAAMVGVAVAMTAPLAVGEAATTQNDLVATSLVMASFATVVGRRVAGRGGTETARSAVAVGIAVLLLAAAAAVKPTVAVFGLPVAALVVVRVLRRPSRAPVAAVLLAAVLGAGLNVPWALRNQTEFGRPMGPDLGLTVAGSPLTALAANSVKNLGHNLAVPAPARVNEAIETVLGSTSTAVSGASPDDTALSFTDFDVDSQRNEDRAANLLQLLLAVGATSVVVASARLRRRLLPIVLIALAGYVLFSSTVRYQAFGGRFMLPLVPLGAVIVAGSLDVRVPRARTVGALVVAACLLQSAPWVLMQKWRPLVGAPSTVTRDDFDDLTAGLDASDRKSARETIDEVRRQRPASVGLVGARSYVGEYLWWRYLAGEREITITHVHAGEAGRADVLIAPWTRSSSKGPFGGYIVQDRTPELSRPRG